MTTELCDHKSVGMLVWKNDQLLLIERKRPPFGFAPPAGHVDGDMSFEESVKRELKEEVGLEANSIQLLAEGRKDNPCRREGGTWHNWKVYLLEARGELRENKDEAKRIGFYAKSDLLGLAAKTEKYLKGEINEDDWQSSPGLEPVWYQWLKELKII